MERGGSDSRYTLVIALITVLAGVVVLLFVVVVGQALMGREQPGLFPPDTTGGPLSTGGVITPSAVVGTPPLAFFLGTRAASPVVVVEATLSDDLDHDGKPDGMADPLGALLGSVVFATRFVLPLLVPPASGFLLKLGEPPVLVGSDHQPALERPG